MTLPSGFPFDLPVYHKKEFSIMDIVQQVKLAQLDLLRELDRICKKNGLPYFMVGGTLIGAVRHNGFIPWDDDIDVGLLWEDYNKLREICSRELDPAYRLDDWYTDPNSPHPFFKLKIKNTHYREEISRDSKMDDGIFIDIFPFDNAPEGKAAQKRQALELNLLRKIILVRCDFDLSNGSKTKKLIYKLLGLLSRVRSLKGWKRSYETVRTRHNRGKTGHVVNMCGAYSYEKEKKPRTMMEKVTEHPFENYQFSIPEDYDTYLRGCYGDYMQLPPEEKRVGIHKVQLIDLGGYTVRSR